jgi:hypothetical protein
MDSGKDGSWSHGGVASCALACGVHVAAVYCMRDLQGLAAGLDVLPPNGTWGATGRSRGEIRQSVLVCAKAEVPLPLCLKRAEAARVAGHIQRRQCPVPIAILRRKRTRQTAHAERLCEAAGCRRHPDVQYVGVAVPASTIEALVSRWRLARKREAVEGHEQRSWRRRPRHGCHSAPYRMHTGMWSRRPREYTTSASWTV